MKVLYVEDVPMSTHVVRRICQHLGYECVAATNASEGLAGLQQQPDIILVDISLPDMDGFQLLHHMRDQKVATPIVAVTAHAMTGERERCLAAGFNDYIAKPFGFEQMSSLLKSYEHRTGASKEPNA